MMISTGLHTKFPQDVIRRLCLPKNTENDGGVLICHTCKYRLPLKDGDKGSYSHFPDHRRPIQILRVNKYHENKCVNVSVYFYDLRLQLYLIFSNNTECLNTK